MRIKTGNGSRPKWKIPASCRDIAMRPTILSTAMSAKGGRRPEFCAEKLFAAAGNALNRQAMDTSRDEAVRAVLYAQETADDAILKLLKAGEATMPEDLKAAWHQLGDGFGHVLRFL